MPSRHQDWFEGWWLFAVLALTLMVLSIWIAGMRQFEVDGVRMVIRFTARTSLLLFCLAFSTDALARPSAPTRWPGCGRTHGRDGSAATGAISASASPPRTPSTPSPLSPSPRFPRLCSGKPLQPPPLSSAASAMPSSSR